ncbi:MAG TPA: hypothetical protein VM103_00300 [Candidatus Paceibacterota bacterium]|nr:hypothetical protein [Candidatus Paceibacterota bacterium]
MRTVRLEWLQERGGLIHHYGIAGAIRMYRECPVDIFRDACFEALRYEAIHARYPFLDETYQQIRDLLRDLVSEGDDCRDEIVRFADLLLFDVTRHNGYGDDQKEKIYQRRAADIEFVIELSARGPGHIRNSDLVKSVIRRALQETDLYVRAPSLPKLLVESVDGIMPPSWKTEKYEYLDGSWNQALRALQLVVRANDTTFLPQLEKVLKAYDEGKIEHYADESAPIPVTPAHKAMFAAAVRCLRVGRDE